MKADFLKSTLGEDGYKALRKALEKSPDLENLVLGRVIQTWIEFYKNLDYNDKIPGTPIKINFKKSEDTYDIVLNNKYSLPNLELNRFIGTVAVLLDANKDVSVDISPKTAQALCKSVDLLVKANLAQQLVKKRIIKA